ncbi:MAG: hypothetical protein ACRDRY_25345, partial [Pseudonocardiaceae bacterium]
MLSLAVAAVAAAALCWPASAGRGRLIALGFTELGRRRVQVATGPNWLKQRCLLLVGLAAGLGALLAGPGGGLAAAMVTGTATARWRAGRDRR